MTVVDHPEADSIAATVCDVLDTVAVAAGFARGQRHSERDRASVIFCADPATLAPRLRARIDDSTHGPDGPRCIDLTVEARRSSHDGWVVTRADLEGDTVPLSNHGLTAALAAIAVWLDDQLASA
jgi:hypothetical protein